MVESTPASTAYEELLCLSIGVTQYEEHLNFETVPSASFDSILVANHFTQKGFNCEQLHNPSLGEVQHHLKLLISKVKDIKKLTAKKEVYVVIYFTGYANEANDVILSNGDTLSLELHAKEYLSYEKVAVLLFQDCMCSKDTPNYGEIQQLNFQINSNPVRLFRCLFRNNTLDRFLKYKIHAQLTNRILLGDMAALLFHRSKVISEGRLDLFIQERELDEFMRTYFTESQNIYAGEIRLIIYRDFQAQLAKYLAEIKKENETPKLMNFIKLDLVANQYCEVVGEMNPINFDLSSNYKFLDIRVPYGKKQQPFSIIYDDDRIAVLMINQTRSGIAGSFSLQGSGVSGHKIVKVTQTAFGQDLYACTNKGKLVRLSLDSGGQLIPGGFFKLPNRIENTQVSSISEYDGILICGLDVGFIQMYRITGDKTSMHIEHMQNVEIFQSHICITDLHFTRNGIASKKWDATYNLLVSGCLNKTQSSWFITNKRILKAGSSSEKLVDGSNTFLDFLVEHKKGEEYKFVNKNRLSNETNVFNIYTPNEQGKVLFINQKSLIYYDMITHQPINTHSIKDTKYQYVNRGDFISQTMLTSKNLSERFYCIPNLFSRILLFCPKRSLLFTLYHSHYASLRFIGKVIFTSSDTFSALVEGEETLEVVQFKIDKELINALNCV